MTSVNRRQHTMRHACSSDKTLSIFSSLWYVTLTAASCTSITLTLSASLSCPWLVKYWPQCARSRKFISKRFQCDSRSCYDCIKQIQAYIVMTLRIWKKTSFGNGSYKLNDQPATNLTEVHRSSGDNVREILGANGPLRGRGRVTKCGVRTFPAHRRFLLAKQHA